jgi:hypothetical protein
MKNLFQIFRENNLEDVDFLEKIIAEFKEPDETNLEGNLIEAVWEFEAKEDSPIPPLNLMEFSKVFNFIEMSVEKPDFLNVRMIRNTLKKPEGMDEYITLFSFTQPVPPPKGEECFLFQMSEGRFLLTALKSVEEKGIAKKFFEKFKSGDRVLFKNFEIENIIYEFNEKYREPVFSCSLIKVDIKKKTLDFLFLGNIQGCAITPKYHHTLFPQNILVGGEPALKCDFYPLFLIIPSLFIIYTDELPLEKIQIPEIKFAKFVEFVNFILSNQKQGMVISLIIAERKKFEHSG